MKTTFDTKVGYNQFRKYSELHVGDFIVVTNIESEITWRGIVTDIHEGKIFIVVNKNVENRVCRGGFAQHWLVGGKLPNFFRGYVYAH